jgi:hypothetical protein
MLMLLLFWCSRSQWVFNSLTAAGSSRSESMVLITAKLTRAPIAGGDSRAFHVIERNGNG